MKILAILPNLKDEVGHIYSYHIAVSRAVSLNHWDYIALVPRNCSMNLPVGWEKGLCSIDWEKKRKWYEKFFGLKNIVPLIHSLKKNNEKNCAVFLEHFTLVDLFSLFLAFCCFRPKMQLWILYRYATYQMKMGGKIHRFLHKLFQFRLKNRLFLFTDSELLAKDLEKVFFREIGILPIPHGEMAVRVRIKREEIFLWWPGGSIRRERGISIVQKIAKDLENSSFPFKLVVSDNVENLFSHKVIKLSRNLSREEYEEWMQKASIVLLPYDAAVYRFGTSGVFVEAVLGEAVPLCTSNTWMTYELEKFNLGELGIDWGKENVLQKIETLLKDERVKTKLQNMRMVYKKYHTQSGFALCISKHVSL